MKKIRNSKSVIALILALVLAIGTPVSILAEDTVTVESESGSESVSEPESAPEQGDESAPESAPEQGEESAPESAPEQENESAPENAPEQENVPEPESIPAPEVITQPATAPAKQPMATGGTPCSESKPDQSEEISGYITGAITSEGGLRTVLKGLPEDKGYLLGRLSNAIPKYIESEKACAIEDPSLIDAEKFSVIEEGYDDNLCWAATAANMLWISGHAQHAVNPYTNKTFASEDEVFDYFRNTFTDQGSYPDGAFNYIFNGKYQYQGNVDEAQLKDENARTGNISDAKPRYGIIYQQDREEFNPFDIVEDMVDMTFGLEIAFWDIAANKYDSSHAITLLGITRDDTQTDFRKRYKGIIIADSDDYPVSRAPHTDFSREEKARLAAGQPNMYVFYPISWELVDNVYYWVITNNAPGSITVIESLYYLSDYIEPKPESKQEDDDEEHDVNNENVNDNDTNDINDIDPLKDFMIKNNLLVLPSSGTTYPGSSDMEYGFFVRRSTFSLLNVYLDGRRLSADGTNYRIVRLPNGMFKIILSKELLRSLGEGKYLLKLEFEGSDDVDIPIEVKASEL